MVKGLEVFGKYFSDFKDQYVIIGGAACDIHIQSAELTPRATKDIDMILIIEALSSEFVKRFWDLRIFVLCFLWKLSIYKDSNVSRQEAMFLY